MDNLFAKIMYDLAAAGVESPRLETRLLLAAAKNCNPAEIFTDTSLNEEQERLVQQMAEQRVAHKPLDKILGHREFYKADFDVDGNVLSPRPDTEILVEKALQYMPSTAYTILDLGTGSGCIIESILLERPKVYGVAVDVSAAALQVAQKNALKLRVEKRLKLIEADWFNLNFTQKIGQKFDVIVTNPPYIPTKDIDALEPEVREYDPRKALDGGADGFESYKRIAELVPDLLNDGGYVLIEAGVGQAGKIADLFRQSGLKLIEIADDLSGIARCVVLQKA